MKRSSLVVALILGFLMSSGGLPVHSAEAPATAPAKKPVKKAKIQPKKGATAAVPAAQAKGSGGKRTSLQVWLSRLKKKVARAESKHNRLVAVAAVRGDETSDAPALYWKGRAAEGPVAMPELKEFDDAINTALNGDAAGAKTKLESFLGTYPSSPLAGEAKDTLSMLNENPQP